jgi:predicted phosphodiesterase
MRVHILSDLHLEFGPFDLPKVDADLVIAAGDVNTKMKGLKWLQMQFPSQPVVYVLGNHEFYGDRLPRLTEKLVAEASGTNIHILEDQSFEIGGYRIFGATLWTDFAL